MICLHAVAAMAKNRVIGHQGSMPWHFPADLKFFKNLTKGHPIVMGRKTWDSLGRPLPGRRNIVLSRQRIALNGAEVIHASADLQTLPGLAGDVFIIGGAEIYRLFLPQTHSVYLTEIDQTTAGDTYFPDFEENFSKKSLLAEDPPCRWYRYERA